MSLNLIKRYVEPIARRVYQTISRASVKASDNDGPIQKIQAGVLADDVLEGIDHIQEYGFASRPLDGAQAVVVCVAGSRDHPVIIATDDGRYRVKLEKGEACIYDDQGQFVKLLRGNKIEIQSSGSLKATVPEVEIVASTKVKLTTPMVEASANMKVTGNLEVGGTSQLTGAVTTGSTITAAGAVITPTVTAGAVAATGAVGGGTITTTSGTDLDDIKTKYNAHRHSENGTGGGTTSVTDNPV